MSKRQDVPPMNECEEPANEGGRYFVVREGGYTVTSWRPGPPRSGPCTQVHVVLSVIDDVKVVMRLKSPRALDELVGVLLQYRKEVWP